MNNNTSPLISERAGAILEEINKAESILLHCHPSPDPDSVGSALSMKFVLEQMGKVAMVIKGDSEIPHAYRSFPGVEEIVSSNFTEVDLKNFDLFIALDSASMQMVSRRGEIKFPDHIKVINIDHHKSNENFGHINLVEPSYPSCTQVLYDLYKLWNIKLNKNIALNLFVGTYSDTGGFRYKLTSPKTLLMAAELTFLAGNFSDVLFEIDNSNSPGVVAMQAIALSSIETFLDQKLAVALVRNEEIKKHNIRSEDMVTHNILNTMRSVSGWDIDATLVEVEPNKIKTSFRTRNENKYDLTLISGAFGGGGHKAAAGATILMPIEEARESIVSRAKELYNL